MTWLAREEAVYYKVFWLPVGLASLFVLMQTLLKFDIVTDIGIVAAFVLPYLTMFASVILTVWGSALTCLGLWYRARVLALIFATIASSLPLLFALGLFVYFQIV